MKQRGRKSLEQQSLTVIEGSFGNARPDPPDDLTARQKEIWRATCDDEPVMHFSTDATQRMLRDYVVTRETIENISRELRGQKAGWSRTATGRKAFGMMSRLLDAHVKLSMLIATKLRITNRSRFSEVVAMTASRNTARGSKPWQFGKDDRA